MICRGGRSMCIFGWSGSFVTGAVVDGHDEKAAVPDVGWVVGEFYWSRRAVAMRLRERQFRDAYDAVGKHVRTNNFPCNLHSRPQPEATRSADPNPSLSLVLPLLDRAL